MKSWRRLLVRQIAPNLQLRWLPLTLIGLAFARLVWLLDAKNLWWDESLSLQRAEANWWDLLRGQLVIYDGLNQMPSIDQHPFFYFVLTGILVRTAGISEFSLRFISVMAATLLVPTSWIFARYLVRRGVLDASAPYWTALFATISPFFLWYGQEARPYALWAWLALFSTYLLLRATDAITLRTTWFAGYVMSTILFLSSHYFAIFLLPVHACIFYLRLRKQDGKLALLIPLGILMIGVLVGSLAAWIVWKQGGGGNFDPISLRILFADLLNAFSMGLSININQAWGFDLLAGAVVLLGILWTIRSWQAIRSRGWLVPALLFTPIAMLLILNTVQPAYMNARHVSLIGGGYLLALGGGMSVIWSYQKWVAILTTATLVVGIGYSTFNYYIATNEYGKHYDDYTGLGSLLKRKVLPGDLLLLKPAFSWRIFRYYLPIAQIEEATQAGVPIAYYGVPFLGVSWEENFTRLRQLTEQYRRVWLIRSGTYPYQDLDGQIDAWFEENTFRIQEYEFFSYSSLRADLYLPAPPVFETAHAPIAHPIDLVFGDLIQLLGYEMAPPLASNHPAPITLYWQIVTKTEDRYKYVLKIVEPIANAEPRVVAITEREPYDGFIPTIYWDPGKVIMEYSEIPITDWTDIHDGLVSGRYRLTLEVYHTETFEKLAVTQAQGGQLSFDGPTAFLPYRLSP